MPAEWRWAGSVVCEGLRVWCLGQKKHCSSDTSVERQSFVIMHTLCSHERSYHQVTHPYNIQVLIMTTTFTTGTNRLYLTYFLQLFKCYLMRYIRNHSDCGLMTDKIAAHSSVCWTSIIKATFCLTRDSQKSRWERFKVRTRNGEGKVSGLI